MKASEEWERLHAFRDPTSPRMSFSIFSICQLNPRWGEHSFSGGALPNYQPLPHCEQSVCKFIDSLTLINKIHFYQAYILPEHFCSQQESMPIVTTAYFRSNPTLLEKIEFCSKLQVKPRKIMLNLKLFQCIFFIHSYRNSLVFDFAVICQRTSTLHNLKLTYLLLPFLNYSLYLSAPKLEYSHILF